MHKKRAQKNAIKHLKPKTPRQATAHPSPIRVSSSTYITSVSNGCPPPPTAAHHVERGEEESLRGGRGGRGCRRSGQRGQGATGAVWAREVGWAREGGVAHEKPALEALHPRLFDWDRCTCACVDRFCITVEKPKTGA